MLIYWRVCEKQETQSFIPRWKNYYKPEIIKKCWLSLQQSVTAEDQIKVFEDKCSKELLNWLQQTSRAPISFVSIPDTGKSRQENNIHVTLPYQMLFEKDALSNLNNIIYWCADDYLHLPQAVHLMKSIYQDGWKTFATTYDYPDRYTLDRTRQAEIFINRYSHWRTIPSCPGDMMAPGHLWLKYKTIILQNATFNNDSWTYEAFSKDLAICPIPGVSTHLTENSMTPVINWQKIWEDIKI